MTMVVFGPYETLSAVHHQFMMLVDTRMHVWHLVVLVLIADVRASLFEDDGSGRILANTRWVAPCFSLAS